MTDERPTDATRGPEGAAPAPEPSSAEPTPMAEPAPTMETAAPMAEPAAPMAAPAPTPAAPPPAAPAAWAAPAAAAVAAPTGQRTTLALVAGILLLIGGVAGIVLGLLVAIVGGSFVASLGDFYAIPDLEGVNSGAFFGGLVAFVGVLVAAYSVAYLLAGIGVIRNSNWARVLGLVVGIISGLIWLSGVGGANAVPDAQGAGSAWAFGLVMFVAHAYIVVALLFFWRTKPAA